MNYITAPHINGTYTVNVAANTHASQPDLSSLIVYKGRVGAYILASTDIHPHADDMYQAQDNSRGTQDRMLWMRSIAQDFLSHF